jgi:hypothetical protein
VSPKVSFCLTPYSIVSIILDLLSTATSLKKWGPVVLIDPVSCDNQVSRVIAIVGLLIYYGQTDARSNKQERLCNVS